MKYNKFSDPSIINERVLYEQISYEIYDSIKSPIILDLIIDSKCPDNYRPLDFKIKFNPIFNSKYNTKITHLFNKQFCIPKYENFKNKYKPSELQYDELIKHSINIKDISDKNKNDTDYLNSICESGYRPCGILDTKNNILCFPEKYNCPLNGIRISESKDDNLIDEGYNETQLDNNIFVYLNTNETIERPIVTSLFLSSDKPWDHEWFKIIAYEVKNDDKKKEKREMFSFEQYDEFMIYTSNEKRFLVSLEDIISWEKNNFEFELEDEKISKFYNLFYKNYIGFENYESLQKYKKLFNTDDYAKSPLYKLSKTLRPSTVSIVFSFIFIFGIIIFFTYMVCREEEPFVAFILACIFTLTLSTIYIGLYFSDFVKFKKMNFNFDRQIQKTFDLYSKRTNQPIYLSLIIIMFITLIPHLVFLAVLAFKGFCYVYDQVRHYCGFCGIC